MQGTIISRHLLGQIFMAVTLLTCILLFTAWLTQSLRYLELIANNGISVTQFLQIIAFLLPSLIVVILPVCCLIATVSVIQRLISENEIVIYQSSGLSPFQIARPFLFVGILLSGFIIWMSNSIAPESADKFMNLKNGIAKEFSAGLLRNGTFSKFNGLTIYVQDHLEGDKLHNVFIYKTETDGSHVSIFAQNGEIITKNGRIFLDLFNGCRQIYTQKIEENKSFFFQQLLYDLEILQPTTPSIITDSAFSLIQLLVPSEKLPDNQRHKMIAEAHRRLIGSYLTFFFMLHGVTILLTSQYRRGGGNKIAFFTVASGVLLQIIIYTLINMLSKSYLLLAGLYFILFSLTLLYFISLVRGRSILSFFAKRIAFFNKTKVQGNK